MALFTCISFSAKVISISTAKVSVHFLKVIFNYFAFSGSNLKVLDVHGLLKYQKFHLSQY